MSVFSGVSRPLAPGHEAEGMSVFVCRPLLPKKTFILPILLRYSHQLKNPSSSALASKPLLPSASCLLPIYQPRPAIRSVSFIVPTWMPRMAIPIPLETSAKILPSL
jgi:hypothetical protein